jgi:hypothetical protein
MSEWLNMVKVHIIPQIKEGKSTDSSNEYDKKSEEPDYYESKDQPEEDKKKELEK